MQYYWYNAILISFFSFLTAWKMEIDYIFPSRIFSSKKSARAKIFTEWKTALSNENQNSNKSCKIWNFANYNDQCNTKSSCKVAQSFFFFFLTTGNRDSSESYKNVKFRKIHFFEDNARVTILIPFSTLSSPKVDQSISKGWNQSFHQNL